MNCQPGDLAIIVSAKGTGTVADICSKAIGQIVRVKFLREPISRYCYASTVWVFEKPIEFVFQGKTYTATGCADDVLRPIRDHGDDAQDETLQWVPVPGSQVLVSRYADGVAVA